MNSCACTYRVVRFITCFCHYYNSRRDMRQRVYVKQGEHIGYGRVRSPPQTSRLSSTIVRNERHNRGTPTIKYKASLAREQRDKIGLDTICK